MADINTPEWIEARKAVLAQSENGQLLENAASELATADDPAALDALGPFFRDAGFLARLDDLNDPTRKTYHVSQVFQALTRAATPEVVPLCLELAGSAAFLADPDRKILLLQALAEAGPMEPATVEVFRAANDEGYFATNACLLAGNSSANAMGLLLEMIVDGGKSAEYLADVLHSAMIPVRDRTPIIEFAGRLAAKAPPAEVTIAAIESIYSYKPEWRRGHPLPPPKWRKAGSEALRLLVKISPFLKKHAPVPAELFAAMDRTVGLAEALLARRGG